MLPLPSAAQTVQVAPETDFYLNLNQSTRLWLQAGSVYEQGSPTQAQIGPSLEVNVKPLLKLRLLNPTDPDKARWRMLTLSVGYRYLTYSGTVPENRVLLEASPRFPLVWNLIATDRNRTELRFIGGRFSWRYRNRLTLERPTSVRTYIFVPYVRTEAYYDPNYGKWSATAVIAGASFPMRKHTEFETYYEHQNQTGYVPNQQLGIVGLELNLYF